MRILENSDSKEFTLNLVDGVHASSFFMKYGKN